VASVDAQVGEVMGVTLFLLFVVLPIAEIYVMVLVAAQIGWSLTLLALLGLSLLGVLVLKGTARAAREIVASPQSMSAAGLPATGGRAADAGFRFLAGVLLVIPGFITGFVGLLLLLPPVRALARAMAGNAMMRRYPSMQTTILRLRVMTDRDGVIQGEVIDPRHADPDPSAGDDTPPALR